MLGVILTVGGLIAAAVGVGWWGLRRALRKGHYCPVCGLWATELEMVQHQARRHDDDNERE